MIGSEQPAKASGIRTVLRLSAKRQHHNVADWPVTLAIACLFVILVIQSNIRAGRLTDWPGLDDATYFRDALHHLDVFHAKGAASLILSILNNPPHSLFSVLLAFFSFLLLGTATWAPYAGNGLLIIGLLALLRSTLGHLPKSTTLCATAFFLTIPFASAMVAEFRPDFAAALLAAASVWLLARSVTKDSLPVSSGLLAGFAILAKPSFFPYFTAVYITAMATAVVINRKVVRSIWRPLFAFVLTALFDFTLKGGREFQYIIDNVFGKYSHIWREPMPVLAQASYFLAGDGGRFLLGSQVFLIAGFIVFAAWFPPLREFWDEKAKVLAATTIVAYIIPSLLDVRTPYSGVVFAALIMTFAGHVLGHILRLIRQAGPLLLSAGLLLFHPVSSQQLQRIQMSHAPVIERVMDAIRTEASERQVNLPGIPYFVLLTTYGAAINRDTIEFLCLQSRLRNVRFMDLHRSEDLAEYRKAMAQADLVVASTGGGLDTHSWLPANRIANRTMELAQQSPGLVPSEPVLARDGSLYRIFQRPNPLHGIVALSGLGLVEGPFPQFGNRKAMWAVEKTAELESLRNADGLVSWTLDAMSPTADQSIDVQQNGRSIATLRLNEPGVFTTLQFQANGSQPVTFTFARTTKGAGDDRRTFAVLFREIRIQ